MYKNHLMLFTGLVVLLLPFLGLPRNWDVFLTTLSGVCLVLAATFSYIRIRLERSQYHSPHMHEHSNSSPTIEPGAGEDMRPDINQSA